MSAQFPQQPELPIFNRRARSRLTVHNPRPGQGMSVASIWLTPELLEALLQLARGAEPASLEPALQHKLREVGLLVGPGEAADPVCFAPWLTREWPELAPEAAEAEPEAPAQDQTLQVVPGIDLLPPPQGWPPELLPAGAPVCWLPRRHWQEIALPYCPDPELSDTLAGLASGRLRPQTLAPELQKALLAAGALRRGPAPPSLPGPQGLAWAEFCHYARASIYAHGYAVIPGLFAPLHLAALRRYIRELGPAGYFETRSRQVPLRDIIHNHPLLQFIHQQLTPLLQGIVPERIQPSYSILSSYHGGAELKRHTDRQQCRWNVSLMLDAEPITAAAWPLVIEYKGEARPVSLGLGDLVLYSGTRTPHWRPVLPQDQEVAVAFFHFVTIDFQGSLD